MRRSAGRVDGHISRRQHDPVQGRGVAPRRQRGAADGAWRRDERADQAIQAPFPPERATARLLQGGGGVSHAPLECLKDDRCGELTPTQSEPQPITRNRIDETGSIAGE
jgi:hypothetical protein